MIRYITARSFDGYSWQTLERKARFIRDVMSPYLDTREIGDVGDTVLSFSEAKALATNNPLLMDKAEADAELSRLTRAERAHRRNQDTLRRAITQLEKHIATQAKLAGDIDTAITHRRDTRGDAFAMTLDDRRYRKRADAGHHLLGMLRREAVNQIGSRQRAVPAGELGGFPLTTTVSRALGQVRLTLTLEGAPGTETTLTPQDLAEADHVGLITRLENRLTRLEATKAQALAEIEHARSEMDHATASIGEPFPQATELTAARARSRHIDEQLEAAATPPQPPDQEPETSGAALPGRQDPPGASQPDSGIAVGTSPDHQQTAHEGDDKTAPERETGGSRRNRAADAHRDRHGQAPGIPEDAQGRSPATPAGDAPDRRHPARPPWPSAAERESGPAPGRGHGRAAAPRTYLGLTRSGSVLPQERDSRQRHYQAAPHTGRTAEEREAGQ